MLGRGDGRGRRRITSITLACSCALVLLAPASARAQTGAQVLIDPQAGVLSYLNDPIGPAVNQPQLSFDAPANQLIIEDPAQSLQPGFGCFAINPNTVGCDAVLWKIHTIVANTGSGSDRVFVDRSLETLTSGLPGISINSHLGSGRDAYILDHTVEGLLRSIENLIFGGKGKDRIETAAADDRLNGGPGQDLIESGGGGDFLWGGAGNDILRGEAGNDRLFGGGGRDRLEDRRGRNRLVQ